MRMELCMFAYPVVTKHAADELCSNILSLNMYKGPAILVGYAQSSANPEML